jgi:poly(A) polymerase
MAQPQIKYLGMTAPISLAGPEPGGKERTEELIRALEPYGCFESDTELNHRMAVLAKINVLVKEWINDLSVEKNMPQSVADTVGGNVYTFGSYRLGVHNKGADIDALCVAPR